MLNIITGDVLKTICQCLVVPVCEDKLLHVDPAVAALVDKAFKIKEFHGKKDTFLLLYDVDGVKAERVLFAGLGPHASLNAEAFRILAGKSVKKGIQNELSDMALVMPDADAAGLPAEPLASALLEGAFLGNHVFDAYKTEKTRKPLKRLSLFTDSQAAEALAGLPGRVEIICRGTLLAREWVSMPSNDKTPDRLVRSFVRAAEKEDLSFTILDEKSLKQNGMGGILAVGAGSRCKPRLLVLDYNPYQNQKTAGVKQTVALVGKGVTFDAGGISLKPAAHMEEMKSDMAGAAAVTATLITLARLEHHFRVVGVIPVAENMPSGDAVRPGDIIKTYSGRTVEITNTDAEGRLLLADAMAYAVKMFKPDILIDLATLTGACVVALGEKIAGVFSKDPALAGEIVAAGDATGERCWAMPMPDDYKTLLKSEFADTNNVSDTRHGGAITGALFLADFAQGVRHAHIDIAGPAYAKKGGDYCPPGGTGFGVRLMVEVMGRGKG